MRPKRGDARENEARRSRMTVENWKEISALSDSQRIPKSSLKKMCRYDSQRVSSQSMVTVCVYVVMAIIAGVFVALLIQYLNG